MGLILVLSSCDLLEGGPKGGPGLEPPEEGVPSGILEPGGAPFGNASPDPTRDEMPIGGMQDPVSPPPTSEDNDPSDGLTNAGAGGTPAPAAGSAPVEPQSPMEGGDPTPPPSGFTDPVPNSCGMESYRLELASDMYLILDESLAMVEPTDLWTPLSEALRQWLTSPTTTGLEVALLGYQGVCDTTAYSQPAVSWGQLPDHAGAMLDGMAASDRVEGGATTPAINGAIQQARARSLSGGDPVSVVLLAASAPAACGSTAFSTALAAASGGLGTPSVQTHVVALGGDGAAYNQVARAGGTDRAIVVADPSSPDSIMAGLVSLLGQGACTFALPDQALGFDPTLVNVWIDDGDGSRLVPHAPAGCNGEEGWVYSSLSPRPSIQLCPAACQALAEGGGSVHVEIGCETVSQ